MKIRNISGGPMTVQSPPKKLIIVQDGETYNMESGMAERLLASEHPTIRLCDKKDDEAMNGSMVPNKKGNE